MKRNLTSILLGVAALLFGFTIFKYSLYLAAMRIYQVDECQNVFAARILAMGQTDQFFASLSLFQFPLSWLARGATQSADLFASARLVSLMIFWLNLILIALATGERLLSRRGLIAFVGAATLAPLWDYGFEIRHDNLLLTGLLFFWWAVRDRPATLQSCVIAGALTVALQFVAFKAFIYTIPLSLLVLIIPRINRPPLWKLALYWAAGAVGTLLLFRAVYGVAGFWEFFASDARTAFDNTTDDSQSTLWATLKQLLTQTPLLAALLLAGVIVLAADLRRRRSAALAWDGCLPEACIVTIILTASIVYPSFSNCDLLYLSPFSFLFAYRYASTVLNTVWQRPDLRPMIVSVVVFAHCVPFGIAARRLLDWPSHRQERLMRLAETLTDPVMDPVFDGIGMVPTRPSIHYQWSLRSLSFNNNKGGAMPRVRDMLAARPAAVIIPNYRTDRLPEEDHEFIRERYVSVADDFWVLGKVLPAGGDTFEIYHPGRYRIATLDGSDLAGTFSTGIEGLREPLTEGTVAGTLDGLSLTNQPVELAVGTHRIECAPDCQPTVVWVGPRLKRPGRLSPSNHRTLFYDWY